MGGESNVTDRDRRRIPAFVKVIADLVLVGLIFVALPIAISGLATRHGWSNQRPDGWNVVGLVPLLAGAALFVWADASHYRAIPPEGGTISWWTQYMLRDGPYARTRNPLYVAEAAMWLGWASFLGSIPLLIGLALIVAGQNAVVRVEEGRLEADFGEAYLAYKRDVPRWIRLARR